VAIPAVGFCVHLQRVRQERRAGKSFDRTVGEYQCFWDGAAIAGLGGQMVERGGPGDNTTAIGNSKDRRIATGSYPLAVQAGERFRTFDYAQSRNHSALPRPGLLLKRTNERSAILIHPGMDYLWSVGCLNPGSRLIDATTSISYGDSLSRVIALIDAMKERLGRRFPSSGGAIPDAVILIVGEP
jgi:Family of unknown function (DUF5675)